MVSRTFITSGKQRTQLEHIQTRKENDMKIMNSIKLTLAASIAVLTLGFASTPASATTTVTTTFGVSATVQSTCLISATALAFGTYTGAVDNATSTVSVTCTNTTPYNVALNPGTATGATVTTRKMTSGSNTLNYSLFSNSGMTTNWGQTVGTDTVTGTGNGSAQTLTVYGQVPASQYVTPGAYADTITASVIY
jgi:spore coat protein U-like protein